MGEPTAADIEGLSNRSITVYQQADLTREGVRGVGGPVSMAARVRTYGSVLVVGANGTGSEFERRPLRPGLPTMDIIFVQQGEFAYLDGGAWLRSTGPLLLAPSGLPNRVRFTTAWKFVVARIPRAALLPFVPMLTDEVRIFPELTLPERAMEAFLEHSVNSEQDVTENDSHTVNRVILEMAGALLRERQGEALAPQAPRMALRNRALAEIANNAGDRQFDPVRLAAVLQVSLRHLQSCFSATGTTIAAEIRRERARTARTILQDPRFDELSINEVSAESGFGSSSSMRRALEDTYHLTATELRVRRG